MKGKSFSAGKRNKNTEHDTWIEIIKKLQWIKSVERVETFETFQKLSEKLKRYKTNQPQKQLNEHIQTEIQKSERRRRK